MESADKSVNIQISEKAVAFIQSRRLVTPVVLVNISFHSSGGSGCGDGCGGGCGEGNSGPVEAYINTLLVDGGKPGADFVRVDTPAGIPVYLAKRVYEAAHQSGSTLIISVRGLVVKKLDLEGLDTTVLSGYSSQGHSNCH